MLQVFQALHVGRRRVVSKGGGHMMIVRQQTALLRQPPGHHVKYGILTVDGHLLVQPSHPGTRPHEHTTLVQVHAPGNCSQQRGLAFAIAAHQAYPFATAHLQVHVIQQRSMTEGERSLFEAYQGHSEGYSRRSSGAACTGEPSIPGWALFVTSRPGESLNEERYKASPGRTPTFLAGHPLLSPPLLSPNYHLLSRR